MKELFLKQKANGTWWMLPSPGASPRPLCTVSECCQKLHKSRRHIYRYIQYHQLNPVAKVFGEILLDLNEVQNLEKKPLFLQPLPQSLSSVFPEYDISELNPGLFRNLIINRVLESGNIKQVRWLIHRYSKKDIVTALIEDGERLLSERALTFWSLYFKTSISRTWRTQNEDPWNTKKL